MKDLIISVLKIFKYAGRFLLFIRNVFFNILLLSGIAILIFFLSSEEPQVPQGSVLRLDIAGDIVEEKKTLGTIEKLLGDTFTLESPEPETMLQDILDVINQSADDARIAVLLLNLKDLGHGGLNQLQAIGQALERFKKTGKQVIAAEDYYTQSQYLLATYANRVLVNPMGGVELHGFGVYRLYFKDALEEFDITYNVFKVGKYKSALEPFTRNSMSPEDQQQNELWLSALWQVYTDEIRERRHLSHATLRNYTDNIADALNATNGNTAQLALKTGLVDELATREQVTAYLETLAPNPSGSPKIISSTDYLDLITPSYTVQIAEKSKIGLIIAEGNILPGKQPPGMIGGDSLATLIKTARENKEIKALVLRINSGGGSAFAAEIIRQELLELKKSGKPVVVSMGSVAASGGYWIAADADEIWASPTTITGSIGIFGAIPTFEKTLASFGVYSDGIGTTPLAAGLDLTQPLPEQLKTAIQQAISYNYNQFLEIVADGRNLAKVKVAELAEGRIYDGQTARDLGLVDKLGSLEDAITAAAGRAKLEEYTTEYIRSPVSVADQLLKFLSTGPILFGDGSIGQNPLLHRLKRSLLDRLNHAQLLDDPRGVYAQCPVELTW